MRTSTLKFLLVAALIHPAATLAQDYGTYVGKVVAEWLPDGRTMKLTEPFAYISPSKVLWEAPKGSVVDGASIPQIAWSIIGGPFEGKYRDASVIHDVACVRRERTWQEVHAAFHTGMLAAGVDSTRAKVMYAAVFHFGPRWERRVVVRNVPFSTAGAQAAAIAGTALKREIPQVSIRPGPTRPQECKACATRLPDLPPQTADIEVTFLSRGWRDMSDSDFTKLRAQIEESDLTLDQIEDYVPTQPQQRSTR